MQIGHTEILNATCRKWIMNCLIVTIEGTQKAVGFAARERLRPRSINGRKQFGNARAQNLELLSTIMGGP